MRLRRETGFALPITIFLVTLMTIMIAAIYLRVSVDRVVASSAEDETDALTIAQSGLQTYAASTTTRPPDGDSIRINVSGGYADVIAHVVRKPLDPTKKWMYLLRSTGRVIKPTQGATPQASRTVAQFATWQTGTITVLGALTAANGLRDYPGGQGGGTVDIRGTDQCGGAAPATAGIRIPNLGPPGYNDPGVSGAPAINMADNAATVAAQTGVQWNATISGGFTPDYTSFRAWDATYPSMLINGNATLTDTGGYGLLIVTGDLTLSGTSFIWYGVVLVGGEIVFESQFNYLYGTVESGLNYQLTGGGNPAKGRIGKNGTTTRVWYYSCGINYALQSLSGFAPVPNAWVDNWATY